MNSGPVARPDNMTKMNGAAGPRENKRGQTLVVPGEDLGDSEGFEAGHGVMAISGRLKAVKQGRLREKGRSISVEPSHTRYIPRPGDLVIGYIEGCTNNIWFIELGAPFNAILPMSLGPGKIDFGGTRSASSSARRRRFSISRVQTAQVRAQRRGSLLCPTWKRFVL